MYLVFENPRSGAFVASFVDHDSDEVRDKVRDKVFRCPENSDFRRENHEAPLVFENMPPEPVIIVSIVVPIVIILDLRPDRSRELCLFNFSDDDCKDDKGKD